MAEAIYHYCDSNEVNTTARKANAELAKGDWSADVILSKIIADLQHENDILSESIRVTHGNTLIANVRAEDKIADGDFICLKQFVKANTYLSNPEIATNAMEVWDLISSHSLNLHKQNYNRQISLSNALIANLNNLKFKPKVDSLLSVAERVVKFASSTAALEKAHEKLIEANVEEGEVIAPSTQKNEVRKIINDKLMPYLEGAADALPDTYGEAFRVISESIENTNLTARSRKTLSQTLKEKAEEEESTAK
eukprot:TRINITY_DN1107_c0_g5_i1.p1 TRINITY_DN1107_c0_g5~~TRINITY_DN1107_c0_g5_i1.p1  ORF type:complete len:252 (-),score=6.15 TRINITY_DN1107_c0_g5_i1:197-952(-)